MKLNFDEFLEIYPWEDKYVRKNGKRLDWFWSFDLNLSVDSLWSFASDTSRLNQAIGLSEMKIEEDAGILHGKSKNAGVLLEWKELPWTWVYGKCIICIREYSKGFAHTLKVIFHFEKLSENTIRFYVYFGWVPRGFFYGMLLAASEKSIYKKYVTLLAEMEKNSQKGNLSQKLPTRENTSMVENQLALSKIKKDLLQQKISKDLLNKLIDYIEYGNELDLYRIRVLELAQKWEVNKRELLLACMYATRAGLLTISWDVICPHCRGTRLEIGSLYEVPPRANCDVCEIDFENDSENSVEITFHVHPSIRNVAKVFFCSAEPAKKPHIKLQKFLFPNESIESKLHLGIGRYRLRIKGNNSIGSLTITNTEIVNVVEWILGDNQNYLSSQNPFIRIRNTGDKPYLFTIEDTSWDPLALKPSTLFSLQEFHDLFSAESLSSDLKLELGLQTVFFTDIVGSSTLYENQGDSKTFVQVKKHFEEINKLTNENEGAIIKTIGDAVMAVFPSPAGAIKTAMSLCKVFNGTAMNGIKLRISIHYGQCIAVNLNSGIDYFGKTVNIAAKIQKLAGASQIVFTIDYKNNPEVDFFLDSSKVKLEEIKYSIPGMKDEYTIYRINAG